MTGVSICRRRIGESFTPTYCGQSFFLRYGLLKKVMPSRAARGNRMTGGIGCRGASWSEELDGKELCAALGGERDQEPRRSPLCELHQHGQSFQHHLHTTVWYADIEVWPLYCITAVSYSSTSHDSVFSPAVCATVFTYIQI